jgi:NADH dehydrogenase
MARHHVVIVGGGFGGLCAARALAGADVALTLIDKRNFHLFQPLLYQVATGLLSPAEITTPLRHILKKRKNVEVLLAEAMDIDLENRRVILADGEVMYDTLIIAAGMVNTYYGHDEWSVFAPGLKTMEDASSIRQKIFYAFEVAERESDPALRQAWLTFAVIGSGSTGVELSGMIAEICRETLKGEFRTIRPEDAQVLLIEAAGRILPGYPPDLSKKAAPALTHLGVRTLTSARVVNIDAEGLEYMRDGGKHIIPARTVLWASGVQASPLAHILAEKTGVPTDRQGRLMVRPDLSMEGHPEIFVIGDMAHVKGKDGVPLPALAPAATQQGRYVARIIKKRMGGKTHSRPFTYFDKGMLSVIGRHQAVADIGRWHFSGFLAWLLWLFVHLILLINYENRLIVLTRWAFQYFVFSRGGRQLCHEGVVRLPISGSDTAHDKLSPGHQC